MSGSGLGSPSRLPASRSFEDDEDKSGVLIILIIQLLFAPDTAPLPDGRPSPALGAC